MPYSPELQAPLTFILLQVCWETNEQCANYRADSLIYMTWPDWGFRWCLLLPFLEVYLHVCMQFHMFLCCTYTVLYMLLYSIFRMRLIFCVCCTGHALTVTWHAHGQTLLQPAVLAAVSAGPVNQAVLLTRARVRRIALLTPPEETLDPRETERDNESRLVELLVWLYSHTWVIIGVSQHTIIDNWLFR